METCTPSSNFEAGAQTERFTRQANFTSDKINLLFSPHTFFTAATASKHGFFLLWKRTSAGTFHRGAPSPNPPDAQPPLPAFFRVSLAFISFHNDQLPLFHLYVKTNPDYWKYPTYNSPLLCSIPFDSRLTHIAFGPIGVRLWGALKPPSSYLLSSSNPGSLETAASVIAFFFSFLFFRAAQCGLAIRQSEACLHSVTDNTLARCQPITTSKTRRGAHL